MWFLERGAEGIQEEHPGLSDLGEDGPVVSGDPREWAGTPPPNPTSRVDLIAWILTPSSPQEEALALGDFLGSLGEGLEGARRSIQAERIQEQDWNAPWREVWHPVPLGRRLLICPSFREIPEEFRARVVIQVDPGMAFGTGTHFTTSACLELLEDCLEQRPGASSVLDVGTGTGILAIAALKLGAEQALGLDLDPDAVAEATENARLNGVSSRFTALLSPLEPLNQRHPLVLANLLAETLVTLAPLLAGALEKEGDLVVSGILLSRENLVLNAFLPLGLKVVDARRDEAWSALRLRR